MAIAQRADDLGLVIVADDDLLAARGQDAAVSLLVEDAGVRGVGASRHVGLVAADDPVGRFLDAAILDARVAAADAILEPQLEVVDLALPPDEERVVLGRLLLGGLAGDRAVLDAPELRIAVPAVERLAVEDRLEAFLRLRRDRRTGRERTSNPRANEPNTIEIRFMGSLRLGWGKGKVNTRGSVGISGSSGERGAVVSVSHAITAEPVTPLTRSITLSGGSTETTAQDLPWGRGRRGAMTNDTSWGRIPGGNVPAAKFGFRGTSIPTRIGAIRSYPRLRK